MRRFIFATVALGVLCVGANAQVIMDQIGANPADLLDNSQASQDFEAAFDTFDIAAIDDFTVSGAQFIVSVDVMLDGFGANNPFLGITSYRVDIYSSVAAGAASVIGDVGSQLVAPGAVTVDTGYAPALSQAGLVTIPVNISLPGAGTYWIGVSPALNFGQSGQVGVSLSTFGAGFPNGLNAFQVNPGGGFGLGTSFSTSPAGNLAYRITAAPVPEPMTLTALAAAFGVFAMRRRKKA